jgi:hypothetical protein
MRNYQSHQLRVFSEPEFCQLFYNALGASSGKSFSETFFIKNYFQSQVTPVIPVFSYFVNSVDKNVRKYSRGKSGKYSFV